MNRREFARRAALIVAGVAAADQLELVEKLGWKRRFFPGWGSPYVLEAIHEDGRLLGRFVAESVRNGVAHFPDTVVRVPDGGNFQFRFSAPGKTPRTTFSVVRLDGSQVLPWPHYFGSTQAVHIKPIDQPSPFGKAFGDSIVQIRSDL